MTFLEWCQFIGYPMSPWLFFGLTVGFGTLMCLKRLRDIHKTLGTVTIFNAFFFMASLAVAVFR